MKQSLLILISAILLTSCAGNHEISSVFSQRKYTKGFFNDSPGRPVTASGKKQGNHWVEANSSDGTITNTVLAPVKTVAPETKVNNVTVKNATANPVHKQTHSVLSVQQKQKTFVITSNTQTESVKKTGTEKGARKAAHTQSTGRQILFLLIDLVVLVGIGFLIAFLWHFTLTVLAIIGIECLFLLGLLILIFLIALVIILTKGGHSHQNSGVHD